MFKVALPPEDYAKYETKDQKNLQDVIDWAYRDPKIASWPPAAIAPGSPNAVAAIDAGVKTTLSYWQQQTGPNSDALKGINDVRQALKEYGDAEKELLPPAGQTARLPINEMAMYNQYRDSWRMSLQKLRAAHDKTKAAWEALTKSDPKAESLAKAYEGELARVTGDALQNYDALLAYTPPAQDPTKLSGDSAKSLNNARLALEKAETDLKAWSASADAKAVATEIANLDKTYLTMVTGPDKAPHRNFEAEMMIYEIADQKLVDAKPPEVSGPLDDARAATEKEYGDVVSILAGMRFGTGQELLGPTIETARFALETSARAKI